jgi:phenylalanyl-tRNA synthetase beta chain
MSDSSYRFERGVDPLAIADVSNYAIALLKQVCGGEVLNGTAEETTGFHKQTKSTIPLRPSRVKSLLGMDVPADKIKTLLHSIECHLTAAAEDQLVFNVPGFRPDLEREVDLIEEIARLIGYDEIPVQTPKLALQANPLSKKEQVARVIRTTLASLGLNEGLSLRFNSKKDIESLFPEGDPRREPVALQNPISEEWGVLPTSLLPRLLHSVSLNLRNQEKQIRLFEISRAYFNDLAKRSDRHPGIKEQDIVSGVIAGDWEYAGLGDQPAQVEFLDLKTIVESLFKKLNLAVVLQRPAEPIAFLHPLQQVEISLNGIVIGCVGGVHPKSAKEFGIKVPTIVFEFELAKVEKFALHQPKFKPFSKFGEMVREVNIIVDESFDQAEMLKKAQNFKAKNLVDIRLRSSYKGKGVPEGKKSLLYQFVYQSAKQTLTDELVNKAQDKLTVKLGEDPSIEYR